MYTNEEIADLVASFRNRTLPAAAWTHNAHLVTGLWFNYNYSESEAICYLRSGIISYNLTSGGENTPVKGYHETMTIFWVKVLRHFISKTPNLQLVGLCNTFLNSPWSSKDLPFQYYTRELLLSTEARAMWTRPDRASISEDDNITW